jgi:hypothetical protein
MEIISKIKWVSGVLLVFVIVLMTNLIDKNNFSKLRYSIATIYEDRIVANDLIFEMSLLIHEKEIAVAMSDSSFFHEKNDKVNQDIQALIERYEQTKLTREEKEIFSDLKNNLTTLEGLEKEFINSGSENKVGLFNGINDIVYNLYDLTKVQLKEGRRQMALSNETMETIDLFTQIEIIFLVLMAILVQIIILYKPRQN